MNIYLVYRRITNLLVKTHKHVKAQSWNNLVYLYKAVFYASDTSIDKMMLVQLKWILHAHANLTGLKSKYVCLSKLSTDYRWQTFQKHDLMYLDQIAPPLVLGTECKNLQN
jgi:hypothetical protein